MTTARGLEPKVLGSESFSGREEIIFGQLHRTIRTFEIQNKFSNLACLENQRSRAALVLSNGESEGM
jgi:hypothetical protein